MRSLAKSLPHYLVSIKKQLNIEISRLPSSEEMKAKFALTNTLFKTSKVEYLGHKIIRNSIIHEMVENENDKFVLIAQRILNCLFFDSHSYADKVSDFDNYDWTCLIIKDLNNCNVTQVNRLSEGYFVHRP